MKNKKIVPVVLAGGAGTRLWPLSRSLYPKQFLSIISECTMLQDTISRLDGIEHGPAIFICNKEHRFIVAEQLREKTIEYDSILLEPVGRNTAPAIAVAALKLLAEQSDPIMLVLPADHAIKDTLEFQRAIKKGVSLANSDVLVTFGITPISPETGYGYIHLGDKIADETFSVSSFIEKPHLEKAKEYLSSGQYLWNSGMFMFKASSYISALEKFHPDMLAACASSIKEAHHDLHFIKLGEKEFTSCSSESIDYAVMEKSKNSVVIKINVEWSDIGSWSALWDISKKDSHGNSIRGDVLTDNTKNSFVYSQNKLIATVGVEDLVIVETKDAVLVARKDKVQNVKNIVEILKQNGRPEFLQHKAVFRPWGRHETIASGPRFHVKTVTIMPGEKTAIQIHYHRAEHWVVVSGTAKVTKDDEVLLLTENESIYIPVGTAHSAENPGKIPLELIEVRTGAYLEEDDVIRLEEYGVGY